MIASTRTLPVDVTRCRPILVDSFCRNCKRWADHPEQTHFHVTRVVNAVGSRDEACAYVPISALASPPKGERA